MVVTKKIGLRTKGNCDIIDITAHVREGVATSGVNSGTVTLFVAGSTGALTTIEHEPGLLSDFEVMWDRTVPRGIPYEHDRAWHDGNGHSHVRASLLGPSLVVPFTDQHLHLGTWQQIVMVDFDNRPRSREIVVQIMGE
ncbi:MAG: secondary thiamine-phosphate synthase enzyme YjbQ [Chloroflexota bacterium]|nr:secondary thiamine-phosphate synthase enzyme YjbQ [Chloroflexota bacterium]